MQAEKFLNYKEGNFKVLLLWGYVEEVVYTCIIIYNIHFLECFYA